MQIGLRWGIIILSRGQRSALALAQASQNGITGILLHCRMQIIEMLSLLDIEVAGAERVICLTSVALVGKEVWATVLSMGLVDIGTAVTSLDIKLVGPEVTWALAALLICGRICGRICAIWSRCCLVEAHQLAEIEVFQISQGETDLGAARRHAVKVVKFDKRK